MIASDALLDLTPYGLERRSGAAVIIDVIGSVRRIEHDEVGAVVGWVETLNHIRADVLPQHGGRLVKSLGDGALLEFTSPVEAVHAALAIQQLSRLPLRIGIDAGDFLSDIHDIYGRSVNRAARLMTLLDSAGIIVSDKVRASIADDHDAVIEDLGLNHLKHIEEPVRAFRLAPPHRQIATDADIWSSPIIPSLAVIPFTATRSAQQISGAGDILCDEMIRNRTVSPQLQIISRLSTTVFRDRKLPVPDMAKRLNAQLVLSGSYEQDGTEFRLNLELADGYSGTVIWRCERRTNLGDIYAGALHILEGLSAEITSAIISRETMRAKQQSLPSLENYTLLLAAISLTNSLSPSDFALADTLLESLMERTKSHSLIYTWRANWLNMKIQQGWSQNPQEDGAQAQQHCARALDADPESSSALASSGLISTTIDRNRDLGARLLDEAIRVNPSNALAWLYRGVNRMFADDGANAVLSVKRAQFLAPLDPAKYLYDSIAASAAFVHGDYAEAERLSRLSLRANKLHASTLRVHVAALWRLGDGSQARIKATELLALEPSLTVSGWLRRSPAADNKVGRKFAECLKAAGIPQ